MKNKRLDLRGISYSLEDSNEKLISMLEEVFSKEYKAYKMDVSEEEEKSKLEEITKKWIEVEMELLSENSILERLHEITVMIIFEKLINNQVKVIK